MEIRHCLMLVWFKDLMNVTENSRHTWSFTPDEGTRQECRNVGSMNFNFLCYIHQIFKPE